MNAALCREEEGDELGREAAGSAGVAGSATRCNGSVVSAAGTLACRASAIVARAFVALSCSARVRNTAAGTHSKTPPTHPIRIARRRARKRWCAPLASGSCRARIAANAGSVGAANVSLRARSGAAGAGDGDGDALSGGCTFAFGGNVSCKTLGSSGGNFVARISFRNSNEIS
jgi:hypothetical protein